MNPHYRATTRATSGADACVFGGTRTVVRSIIEIAQLLWPFKTSAELASRAGVSQRSAEHWMGGRSSLSAEALAGLLRSEEGLQFLSAVMADSDPQWWRLLKRQAAIADARRLERAAQQKLKEAIDADRDLTAAIERAEVALCVHGEDRAGARADALRAASRLPHRALARSARR